jgi:hypothetical protein
MDGKRYTYIHIYTHIYVCVYIYVYIYIDVTVCLQVSKMANFGPETESGAIQHKYRNGRVP